MENAIFERETCDQLEAFRANEYSTQKRSAAEPKLTIHAITITTNNENHFPNELQNKRNILSASAIPFALNSPFETVQS